MNFISLDFETANPSRVSVCAVGLAVFEAGRLAESFYRLVRPPAGHDGFHPRFVACHGLTPWDVRDAPEFPALAAEVLTRLTRGGVVVAHNAAFDIPHLRAVLDHFGLARPAFDYLCTCQLARRVWPDLVNHRLNTLAAHIGLDFRHHHAQADAEAAGHVLAAMLRQLQAETLEDLLQLTGRQAKRF